MNHPGTAYRGILKCKDLWELSSSWTTTIVFKHVVSVGYVSTCQLWFPCFIIFVQIFWLSSCSQLKRFFCVEKRLVSKLCSRPMVTQGMFYSKSACFYTEGLYLVELGTSPPHGINNRALNKGNEFSDKKCLGCRTAN